MKVFKGLTQDFAYAHGRLGVLMTYLLDLSDLDRLIGAPDYKAAKDMLRDIKFIQEIAGKNSVQETLDEVLKKEKGNIEGMVPAGRRPIFSILWIRYDAPYLAYLIKKNKGLTSSVSLPPHPAVGAYGVDALQSLVEGKETAAPTILKNLVVGLLAKEDITAREIDANIALFVAKERLWLAKQSGSKTIEDFVRHHIDVKNVRTFLRTKEQKDFMKEFLPGGLLPRKAFSGENDSLDEYLTRSPYDYAMRSVIPETEKGEYLELEYAIASIMIRDIHEMRNLTFGPEPVFAYAATVVNQITLLRALMIGKKSGFSPQELKYSIPPLLTSNHYS